MRGADLIHEAMRRLGLLRRKVGYVWLLSEVLSGKTRRHRDMMQGAYRHAEDDAAWQNEEILLGAECLEQDDRFRSIASPMPWPEANSSVYPEGARPKIDTPNVPTTRPLYVARLNDATVVGREGWVQTREGKWLGDHLPRRDVPPDRPQGQRRVEGQTAHLATPDHQNYYHWVHQMLPVIDAICGQEVDQWLVSGPLAPFARDILASFGISESKLVSLADGPVSCESLLLATPPTMGVLDHVDGWPLRAIRERFPTTAKTPWRKLYLRRDATAHRKLLNAAAVEALLVKHGFEVHEPDTLTVEEQAQLLSEAKAVVAVHGAALANLVFMPPGGSVVELLPRHWPSPLFSLIAAQCGLRHAFVVGCEPYFAWTRVRTPAAALKVPLRHLRAALDAAETI